MYFCLFQGAGESAIGMTNDPVRSTYWIYTNRSIIELRITDEDREIWKVYLERGAHDTALSFAKVFM